TMSPPDLPSATISPAFCWKRANSSLIRGSFPMSPASWENSLNTSFLLGSFFPGGVVALRRRGGLAEPVIEFQEPAVQDRPHQFHERLGGRYPGRGCGRRLRQRLGVGEVGSQFHANRPPLTCHPADRVLNPLLSKRIRAADVRLIIPGPEPDHQLVWP